MSATAAFQGHYRPPAVGIEPLSHDGEGSTVKPSDLRKHHHSEPASSISEATALVTSFNLQGLNFLIL